MKSISGDIEKLLVFFLVFFKVKLNEITGQDKDQFKGKAT